MFTCKQLKASAHETDILRGVDLHIPPGQVHVIMGPNGSGKSTLSSCMMGDRNYQVTADVCQYQGQDLLSMSMDERSLAGIFLAYQNPVAISGVNNMVFLKAMMNKHREAQQLPPMDVYDVMTLIKQAAARVGLDESFLMRDLNDDFSGGERKRNEILQMILLQPKLCVLDEIDSGLDVDALKMIAQTVNDMRSPDRSFVIVTHYQRMLDLIEPCAIHVMKDGVVQCSGGSELADKIEAEGFSWLHEGQSV